MSSINSDISLRTTYNSTGMPVKTEMNYCLSSSDGKSYSIVRNFAAHAACGIPIRKMIKLANTTDWKVYGSKKIMQFAEAQEGIIKHRVYSNISATLISKTISCSLVELFAGLEPAVAKPSVTQADLLAVTKKLEGLITALALKLAEVTQKLADATVAKEALKNEVATLTATLAQTQQDLALSKASVGSLQNDVSALQALLQQYL